MRKPNKIKDLMSGGSVRLTALKNRALERSKAIEHVRAALSPALAKAVASAGIEGGILRIGVKGAAWASRLRYTVDILRSQVGDSMGVDITRVRIQVVPPPGSPEPHEPHEPSGT